MIELNKQKNDNKNTNCYSRSKAAESEPLICPKPLTSGSITKFFLGKTIIILKRLNECKTPISQSKVSILCLRNVSKFPSFKLSIAAFPLSITVYLVMDF